MKGSECKFVKYMEGPDKRFVIPVYQRNYDWKIEQCKQLYDDLVKIVKDHRKSHFFGSLVSVYNPNGSNEEYLVIDGQQRLTTVSLLFLAMYNLLNDGYVASKKETLQRRIMDEYLVDEYEQNDTRIKLKPVKNDRTAFSKLFADPADYIRESNLTVNYKYFYERIKSREITIDELFDAICCLEIINVKLNSEDNPQLIFESLNSTGLDLSEGDKIRNFILMGLPVKEQNEYYETYWNKIEIYTKYDVSAFIRDYLSVKQQQTPSQTKIYLSFKDYVGLSKIPTEPLLKDMLEYAKRYELLLDGNTGNKVLDACIYRLNRLETTVTRPFLLEVLRMHDEGKLSFEQVQEIFLITENYLFRRNICEMPTNALNKIFLLLHREIRRYDGTEDNYVEKFKFALTSRKERGRFPDDEEFTQMFITKPIYLMQSKNKVYIFERLENFNTKEDKDIYRHCDEGDYSIEHIMPQHLTPEWQKELGKNYEEVHETWLHRIANLTLTGYNSKYSNNSFKDKKTMQGGFQESGIRLNKWISEQNEWTLKELEERSRLLSQRALQIWPRPVTNYKPQEKQLESCTLDDDMDLKGRSIVRFVFKKTEMPVASWVEMYQKVLQILYAEDPTIITGLAVSKDEGIASHFTMNTGTSNKWLEIQDGIYVYTNTNTQSKANILNNLFKLYHEDAGNLVFYLKGDNEKPSEEDAERYAQRLRYWEFSLPIIRKAVGEKGPFHDVNPSTGSWINSAFGFGGFSINCVANSDSARTELVLGNVSAETNKAAFDLLKQHKDEIEKMVGRPMLWNRGNDKKSSKVYVESDSVNVRDDSTWPLMADFHAEWVKKIYDVLVPIILSNATKLH